MDSPFWKDMGWRKICWNSDLSVAGHICTWTRTGSDYKLLIEGAGKILISNHVRFNENLYQYQNCNMVKLHLSDMAELDILNLDNGGYKWVKYTLETNLNDFKKIHSGGSLG
jgi:hypothetical protein